MAKLKRMEEVRQILRTYEEKKEYRKVARILGVSKNTVKKIIRAVLDSGSTVNHALTLSEGELSKIVYSEKGAKEDKLLRDFQGRVAYFITELKRPGVTRQLLWEEYLLKVQDGYRYSRFCELLRDHIGAKNLTMAMQHRAAKALQLDFAGKHMHYVDLTTGEVVSCEILIGILPHSCYTFAIALPSQKIGDFVHGIVKTLAYFGGVPEVILSDNLKSYVTKPDRYEPKFTELCNQLGAHYAMDLDATRAGKPKDKGAVENAVKNAYTRIFAPLRNQVFHSIEELNTAILSQLEAHNAKPFQKRLGSRKSVFEAHEKALLQPLPSSHFEIKYATKGKVQRNYHVYLGGDKCYYSVHYRYVGKQAYVYYTRQTVEIYIDNQRVATHKRMSEAYYDYVTKDVHMPKAHQKQHEIQGYTASYFTKKARALGEFTHWAIDRVLRSRRYFEHSYKSCLGILRLAEKYTPARLETAAKICAGHGQVNYTRLKRILEHNLDIEPPEDIQLTIPFHENIRGEQAYK